MTIAVEEARAEIGCLQDFLLEGPHVDSLLLLSEAPGGSELREEFGYRIREVGPLDEFGFQVIDDLKRRGLLPAEQAGSVGEVSREEVGRVEAIPRTAVLDVDVHSCRCVAGPPCQHMWPAQ
jgi:hypothetical protein